YERSQVIFEKAFGLDHPNVAAVLHNRAGFLIAQEKHTEALPLLERALRIRTNKLGENHPGTVGTRSDLEFVREKV
ncbi:unnamed protein product, partial [Ectocarpus sp. 8 AP-2014]